MGRSCDWCTGGAFDLVYNDDRTINGEIDRDTGDLVITAYSTDGQMICGSRKVRFCPMCGRPVGNSKEIRFLKKMREIFGDEVGFENIHKYFKSSGWNIAKEEVPEFKRMYDTEILRYFDV